MFRPILNFVVRLMGSEIIISWLSRAIEKPLEKFRNLSTLMYLAVGPALSACPALRLRSGTAEPKGSRRVSLPQPNLQLLQLSL